MKKLFLVILILGFGFEVLSQDPQFSQFYAAPLYLNPGFTGSVTQHRFVGNHRLQWPGLPQAYSTFAASYDYHAPGLNSGFGFLAHTDQAGSANLRTTGAALLYSYFVSLKNKIILKPAISMGYTFRSIDYDKLLLGDQIDFGIDGAPTTDPLVNSLENRGYFDLSAGFVIYNNKWWFGYAAHHINRPNQSILSSTSELPIRHSVHGGARFPLQNAMFRGDTYASISPGFVYRKQGTFDQLDLGFKFDYSLLFSGVWYRGVPFQKETDNGLSRDAIILLFGVNYAGFEVGYSFDFGVNRIGRESGGAHELSIVYLLVYRNTKKVHRKEKFLPCPAFYKKH